MCLKSLEISVVVKTANNVFEQFATNTCQVDRPVARSSRPMPI